MGVEVCPRGAHLIRRIAVQDMGEATGYTHAQERLAWRLPCPSIPYVGKHRRPPAKSD